MYKIVIVFAQFQKIEGKYIFSKFYKKIFSTNRRFIKTERRGEGELGVLEALGALGVLGVLEALGALGVRGVREEIKRLNS